jgi:hypothetical protein
VASPLHARQVSVWLCSSLEILHRFKQANPSSDGRLPFLPKPLPSVLTLIHYKKVQSISQRSPVQWRVETRFFPASFQRKAGISLPRRQIFSSVNILLPTSHQIPCEWIWGVLVGSPLHARQVSVWLCVGKEMPISRIVVAVPNATVVLLD